MGSRKFEGGWVCVCSKRLFFCHGAGVCTWHVAAGRYKYRAASALLLSCSSPSISQLSLQNYHPNPSCSSVSPSLKDQWNECMFVSPCASTYTCSEVMICCFSMSPKHVSKNSMFVSASSGSNEIHIAASLTSALVLFSKCLSGISCFAVFLSVAKYAYQTAPCLCRLLLAQMRIYIIAQPAPSFFLICRRF